MTTIIVITHSGLLWRHAMRSRVFRTGTVLISAAALAALTACPVATTDDPETASTVTAGETVNGNDNANGNANANENLSGCVNINGRCVDINNLNCPDRDDSSNCPCGCADTNVTDVNVVVDFIVQQVTNIDITQVDGAINVNRHRVHDNVNAVKPINLNCCPPCDCKRCECRFDCPPCDCDCKCVCDDNRNENKKPDNRNDNKDDNRNENKKPDNRNDNVDNKNKNDNRWE